MAMKGVSPGQGTSVTLMAQQFQNLVRMNQDTPPPPPQSQPPPIEDAINSLNGLSLAEASPAAHRQQLHQQRNFELGSHLNQLVYQQHQVALEQQQQQPFLLQAGPGESSLPNAEQLLLAQINDIALSGQQPTGIARLIDDLRRLLEDHETADIVFLLGNNEMPVYAHRAILQARCRSFQNVKQGEICHIFGSTVSPANGNNNVNFIRWPQANGVVLSNVLHYVYTGKIEIHENEIFEALAIGYELGLDELVAVHEQHINATIAVHNVCAYLDATLSIKRRLNENDWNRLVHTCLQFFSEHCADCVKTPSFVNLSKPAITQLVSSDFFSLDEADVFRCVLEWAKHQTGIMSPCQHWSEEERSLVCQQLAGVINHIRILLIDSQVFAEEVEPTGVVPIELSLERYRFAALAASKHEGELTNKRVQPRLAPVSKHFFANSKLLCDDAALAKEQILNTWYGVPKQTWRLIFRASSHNFSADAFHAHCDGISPTFTLVQSLTGWISGGFSDVPWSRGDGKGRGRFEPSKTGKGFLFTLHCPDGSVPAPMRYDIKKKMFAIAQHPNFGPVFGAGADLSIADRCHMTDASYSNLPHTYDGENASNNSLFGDYNFTVLEYEVFTLAD